MVWYYMLSPGIFYGYGLKIYKEITQIDITTKF